MMPGRNKARGNCGQKTGAGNLPGFSPAARPQGPGPPAPHHWLHGLFKVQVLFPVALRRAGGGLVVQKRTVRAGRARQLWGKSLSGSVSGTNYWTPGAGHFEHFSLCVKIIFSNTHVIISYNHSFLYSSFSCKTSN